MGGIFRKMEDPRIPKRALAYRTIGHRELESPRLRWI